jgi:magnesium chelatase accessory protein
MHVSSSQRLNWEREGPHWPHHAASRFVHAAGLRWHVQVMGEGPVWLLLHGTGASTHSWRGLAPRLARHATVVMPDLPGHGFTDPLPNPRQALPAMATALGELLQALKLPLPQELLGHSAGAALGARMVLDGRVRPRRLVSINGALQPFQGVAGVVFAPMARLLATQPLVPRLFAWRARDGAAVRRLVASTGSRLDDEGLALYARLVRSPAHVAGALAMMANWDLAPLWHALPRLAVPLHLISGSRDGTVPPAQAEAAARHVPGARVWRLADLGHLAHEEAPQAVEKLLRSVMAA